MFPGVTDSKSSPSINKRPCTDSSDVDTTDKKVILNLCISKRLIYHCSGVQMRKVYETFDSEDEVDVVIDKAE